MLVHGAVPVSVALVANSVVYPQRREGEVPAAEDAAKARPREPRARQLVPWDWELVGSEL